MQARYYRNVYHRRPRRTSNWLAICGRVALVLWTVALIVGFLTVPRSPKRSPGVGPARLTPGVAVAAQSNTVQGHDAAKETRGSVTLGELTELTALRLPKATPLAFLNSTRFAVDRTGRLVAPEALARRRDLPVITCAAVAVDPERYQVLTDDVLEALQFLATAQEVSPALFCRISQVVIDPELGVTLYLESGALPVLVGREHVKRKVAYLATVLRHLDSGQGLAKVRFLDLRLDGQVVARLERAS